ncbi:MAG: serine hydrolase domain-containing protein [Bacteroidota bacterium]|nr:serine hydrolase domain-containing protein [Bacteroidota bacterium]
MVFLSQFLFSQQYDFEKLDRYFDSLKENNRFMGTISLSKGNELIYTRSIGFLDFENNILLDSNSKFRIGSISKTFTSVLILKSEEDGKLNLNDTIENFFPDLPKSEKITIENLLSHRSGIFNFTDSPEYIKYSVHPKSREELIKIISNFDSVFKPGRRSEYSNSNYILLTIILEKLYSKNYSDILSEKITKPYELNNTYYGDKVDIKNNEAKSYMYAGKWIPQDETDPSVPLGAGGIVSNPSDLAKFSYLLFSGKILKNQSLEKMKKINGQYGLGIFTIPFYKRTAFGHTGGIDGFSSIFAHFTDDEVSYALNSNGTNFNNNDITIAVLSAVFDKPYEIPTFSSYDYLPKDLKELLGSYSSEEIPLIIEVTMEGSILMIQATGQPRISLEAVEKNNFKSDIVGVEIEFKPEKNSFILRQNGAKIKFVKNK